MFSMRLTLLGTLLLALSCSSTPEPDAGPADAEDVADGGASDGLVTDLGERDLGELGDTGLEDTGPVDTGVAGPIDNTNVIFVNRSADCTDYADSYAAFVNDIKRSLGFEAEVSITFDATHCVLVSDNIPNHDFNDQSANFATNVSEVAQRFEIPRNPTAANTTSRITQRSYDAVMLNGVPVDILSAGCYRPDEPRADANGNVAIGCNQNDPWLLDPLGTGSRFGADQHNAHTQPDGSYHYHGDPMAMWDDNPGANGSPVIGFAADGFPIYGSYFLDPTTNQLRKATSGYTLKPGERPSSPTDPGGAYDGLYIDDWEFTDAGDLDACNGMTVNGQYGYYITDSYPWIIACHTGTPDPSFNKN